MAAPTSRWSASAVCGIAPLGELGEFSIFTPIRIDARWPMRYNIYNVAVFLDLHPLRLIEVPVHKSSSHFSQLKVKKLENAQF